MGTPSKLHPCAFYTGKLNPTKYNNNVENRKLLAIEVALEDWKHWLEGAEHPFLILTNHHNLEHNN